MSDAGRSKSAWSARPTPTTKEPTMPDHTSPGGNSAPLKGTRWYRAEAWLRARGFRRVASMMAWINERGIR